MEGKIQKFKNINKPPFYPERHHSRVLHAKSGEDPTKTEEGVGFFCDSAKIPPKRQKNLPKIQKLKYRQSPMSCFEGPEADSVKVWCSSDQN